MSKLWVSFEIKILNYELNYEIVKLWRIQRNYDFLNKKSQWWVNTEHKNATFKNDEIHSRNHVKKNHDKSQNYEKIWILTSHTFTQIRMCQF